MTKKKNSLLPVFIKNSEPYTFAEEQTSRAKSLKRTVPAALLATLVAVLGIAKFSSSHSQRTEKNRKDASTLVDTTQAQKNYSDNDVTVVVPDLPPLTAPETLDDTLPEAVYIPDYPLEIPSAIDLKASLENNAVSNQLFRQVAACAPAGMTTNMMWQCTSLLQKLSTTNDTCMALQMTPAGITNFINMATCMPSNQLVKACSTNSADKTWFSFNALSKALKGTNETAIAQETFLQKNRYLAQAKLAQKLPEPGIEDNKLFIYWDSAHHPTVGVGINLDAHPRVLALIRIKNSENLQKILWPKDASKRSDSKYITLTKAQLNLVTADVIANNHAKDAADTFKKTYGLEVHPDDCVYLDNFFNNEVAKAITNAEKDLEKDKPDSLAHESVLFGSYTNAIPLDAVVTAADIRYNSGQNLRDKWERFSNAYTDRDFATARTECIVTKKPNKQRNDWRQENMSKAQREMDQRNKAKQSVLRSVTNATRG